MKRSDYIAMGEAALERGSYAEVPFGFEASIGTVHHLTGEPEKAAMVVRRAIARIAQVCHGYFRMLCSAWALINCRR